MDMRRGESFIFAVRGVSVFGVRVPCGWWYIRFSTSLVRYSVYMRFSRIYIPPCFLNYSRSCIVSIAVSYTHLRAHETDSYLVCRLLLEKKKYAVFCLKKKNSFFFFFFLMIRRQPRSTHCISSAASDVYKRQLVSISPRAS